MRRNWILLCGLLASLLFMVGCGSQGNKAPKYESVPNDMMGVRIYTLDNGLKLYTSVNKEEPRIQATVAVRVGSKNDPEETTGLSHYLEHLMFKGTSHFGTSDYAHERPYLDTITQLYEQYRALKDPAARKALYKTIDSFSYVASTYAIPNEYDKLMAAIGSEGTNAFTSNDMTCYVEDFPSNQLENWARVQGERFGELVLRGFHTELEAVYEEKNMSLDQDDSRLIDSLLYGVFSPHHYGTQTTLGTQEHLKNPSLLNIQKHFDTYYVPNNMAVCIAGDFDPDSVYAVVNRYFGSLKANDNLPTWAPVSVPAKSEPCVKYVDGLQPEELALGWLMPGARSEENLLADMVSSVLYNGSVGLLDVNVNQPLKALSSYAGHWGLTDYDVMIMIANPLQGQSLDQLRELILAQVDKLRKGEFSDSLLSAIINHDRYYDQRQMEKNRSRAMSMVESFINQTPWEWTANRAERMKKITKQQVVDFANKYLTPNGYTVVYKRQQENKNKIQIEKPAINPIKMNRDSVSQFVRAIQNATPSPIEPKFVDFSTELQQYDLREGVKVLQSKNTVNQLFNVRYRFEFGSMHSRTLAFASNYLNYIGSEKYSLQAFNQKMFALGCEMSLNVDDETTTLEVYGLNENIKEALETVEGYIRTLVPDGAKAKEFVAATLRARADAKASPQAAASYLRSFNAYGPKNPRNTLLSNAELESLDPQVMVDELKNLFDYPHTICYYAPDGVEQAKDILNAVHPAPATPRALPAKLVDFKYLTPTQPEVFHADFPMQQFMVGMYASKGTSFNLGIEPVRRVFNEYFGGSMNSVVFQEIRESRALAYSAWAGFISPSRQQDPYYTNGFIATQADKLATALSTMTGILNEMPVSEHAFSLAKEAVITSLRTNRTSARNRASYYLHLQRLGFDYDINRTIFEKVQNVSIEDLKAFYANNIKGGVYRIALLGDKSQLPTKELTTYGKLQPLSLSALYGY